MNEDTEAPLIHEAPVHVEGVLAEASNLTLRVQFVLDGEPSPRRGVYKPISGERPLPDFPLGSLARREVAAYRISELGGWGLVPTTILRDGPMGLGSVQLWKDIDDAVLDRPACGLLDVVRPQEVPPGWLSVLDAQDERGAPLTLIHRDEPSLASLAVLDLALNNADRKAAHIALDGEGRLWGFDHGLIGHVDPKLRTVLWGWAGTPLPLEDLTRLHRLCDRLASDDDAGVASLLSVPEVRALQARVERLISTGQFPDVPYGRYPLPWPLW